MEIYVKICPKCGHYNPEDAITCEKEKCAHYLAMEQSQLKPEEAEHSSPVPGALTSDIASVSTNEYIGHRQERGPVTQVCVQQVLYLDHKELPNPIEVQSGCVVGQKHPGSRADVQIDGIQNVNYISREHCHFNCVDGIWSVLVLPETTNPTTLNQRRISKGEEVPISNGDQLVMANVGFQIRIIQT